MPTPELMDDEVPRTVAPRKWYTLDEAAIRLRFPTKRALLYYLRRNPAPIFRRNGSRRYFMKDEDIDRVMVRVARLDSDTTDAKDEEFRPAAIGASRAALAATAANGASSDRRRKRGVKR